MDPDDLLQEAIARVLRRHRLTDLDQPGAYLRKKKMGCRIEDVILVTEDGNINLSAHLPSRPDEIEKLMRDKGVQQGAVGLRK